MRVHRQSLSVEQCRCFAVVQDSNLRHTLQFGIGMHHAGLGERDRKLVERLFVEQKIQVHGRASKRYVV